MDSPDFTLDLANVELHSFSIKKLIIPCPDGPACRKKYCDLWHSNSPKIRPNDMASIGKTNLLYISAYHASKQKLKYFDITVIPFSGTHLKLAYEKIAPINLSNWSDLLDSWTDTATAYEWNSKHIYQNFANNVLGGGTLGLGNVQEEIMMRSLALIQYLYNGSAYDKKNILSSSLELNPLLVDTYVVVTDKSGSEHYSQKGLIWAKDRHKAYSLYEEIDQPIPVKIMCVAMPHLGKPDGSSYNLSVLVQSLMTLIKGFVVSLISGECDADLAAIHINIGNIGCGVFNHNVNTIHILQKTAYVVAAVVVKPTKPVHIHYHTYTQSTLDILNQYAVPVFEQMISKSFSVEQILLHLDTVQKNNKNVWAKHL